MVTLTFPLYSSIIDAESYNLLLCKPQQMCRIKPAINQGRNMKRVQKCSLTGKSVALGLQITVPQENPPDRLAVGAGSKAEDEYQSVIGFRVIHIAECERTGDEVTIPLDWLPRDEGKSFTADSLVELHVIGMAEGLENSEEEVGEMFIDETEAAELNRLTDPATAKVPPHPAPPTPPTPAKPPTALPTATPPTPTGPVSGPQQVFASREGEIVLLRDLIARLERDLAAANQAALQRVRELQAQHERELSSERSQRESVMERAAGVQTELSNVRSENAILNNRLVEQANAARTRLEQLMAEHQQRLAERQAPAAPAPRSVIPTWAIIAFIGLALLVMGLLVWKHIDDKAEKKATLAESHRQAVALPVVPKVDTNRPSPKVIKGPIHVAGGTTNDAGSVTIAAGANTDGRAIIGSIGYQAQVTGGGSLTVAGGNIDNSVNVGLGSPWRGEWKITRVVRIPRDHPLNKPFEVLFGSNEVVAIIVENENAYLVPQMGMKIHDLFRIKVGDDSSARELDPHVPTPRPNPYRNGVWYRGYKPKGPWLSAHIKGIFHLELFPSEEERQENMRRAKEAQEQQR
jgi:hypothetical protein